jgi:peptide deformylase
MSNTLPIQVGRKNEVLRNLSAPLKGVDSRTKKLIQKMIKTVKKEEGVGIAAPQIGENIRLMIAMIGRKYVPMINPTILSHSEEKNIDEEGCLSVPGEYGKVSRFTEIELEFFDEKFQKKKLFLKNFDARVVQHEIDHLDGILFVDRMTESHKKEMEAAK